MSGNTININIGVLGHVDSGKTSLAKCLSNISSTAAFDKNPQSQQRGITLDLGFSSFSLPTHDHPLSNEYDRIQFTLVDCPGHASLIKTIIGGAQIIDMMVLVIDVNKGIQTQTAECLVIGEITCRKMVVVLNKIDLLESAQKEKTISKVKSRVLKTLSTTAFANLEVPVLTVSANTENPLGIDDLKRAILSVTTVPHRSPEGPFRFAIDHCFPLKGQGTVMTGTILQGSISVNDTIYLPSLGVSKKIKSMQMFKRPVTKALQGDRLGICVTQFDSKLLERGVACTPGYGTFINWAVIKINLVKYFKQDIESKMKFHVTLGYENVMAKITLFQGSQGVKLSLDVDYKYLENVSNSDDNNNIYGLLEFEKSLFVVDNSLLIGSKLDSDINKNICRIAFWGYIESVNFEKSLIKIYKIKTKVGQIDRIANDSTLIVKGMFKKESNIEKFTGLTVNLANGQQGEISGPFGQSGKIKVTVQNVSKPEELKNTNVTLHFKKYVFQEKNAKIKQ